MRYVFEMPFLTLFFLAKRRFFLSFLLRTYVYISRYGRNTNSLPLPYRMNDGFICPFIKEVSHLVPSYTLFFSISLSFPFLSITFPFLFLSIPCLLSKIKKK